MTEGRLHLSRDKTKSTGNGIGDGNVSRDAVSATTGSGMASSSKTTVKCENCGAPVKVANPSRVKVKHCKECPRYPV